MYPINQSHTQNSWKSNLTADFITITIVILAVIISIIISSIIIFSLFLFGLQPLSQTYSCTDLTNDYLSIGLCSPPLFSRTSPSSFCGLPSAKYPDRWPMGYPLDRKSPHETIEAFVNEYPNMRLHDFVIKHLEAANLKMEDDTVECLRFRCWVCLSFHIWQFCSRYFCLKFVQVLILPIHVKL